MFFSSFYAPSSMLKSSLLLLAVLTGRAYTVSPSSDPVEKRQSAGLSLVQQLQLAATAVDRLALLQPSELVFDFNEAANPKGSPGVTEGNGGRTVKADRKSFPALIGSSASMTLGFLGPCGFVRGSDHGRFLLLKYCVGADTRHCRIHRTRTTAQQNSTLSSKAT